MIAPHVFVRDPDADNPDACGLCPLLFANDVHIELDDIPDRYEIDHEATT